MTTTEVKQSPPERYGKEKQSSFVSTQKILNVLYGCDARIFISNNTL